jgi:hypothetical protein
MEEEDFAEDIFHEEGPSMMIDPKYAKMYEFEMSDSEKFIVVEVKIPENFDHNILTVELHKNRHAIRVEAEGMLPIVKGTLLAQVRDMKYKYQDGSLVITIQKQERGLWEAFIIDPYPDSNDIDPQSAFAMGISYSHVQSELMKNFQMLALSAAMGYVPGMCFLAKFYLNSDASNRIDMKNVAMQLFNQAIEKYNSAPAMVTLADYLLREGGFNHFSKSYAMSLLKRATQQNYQTAHYYIGLALSPLSDIKGVRKDAKEAIKEFELAGEDNAFALHELAMLYYNGVGVKKNLPKANELQIKARKLNKNIEPLQKPKTGYGVKFVIFVILFILAVLAGFIWNEYIKSTSK